MEMLVGLEFSNKTEDKFGSKWQFIAKWKVNLSKTCIDLRQLLDWMPMEAKAGPTKTSLNICSSYNGNY